MKSTTIPLAIATLMAALAATAPAHAQAQKPDADDVAKAFSAADKDGNGRLTLEEAKAGMPRVAKNFDRIDKDKKGYVTLDQIKAMMATR
jgi:Ca2+-binding EF-hand superfamily protein